MRIICRTDEAKSLARAKIDAMPLPSGPDYNVYQVEITKYEPNRTLAQSALFHKMVEEMGKEIGYPKGEMKDMVKIKLRPWMNVTRKVDGVEYTRLFSTSDLSVPEFADLLDDLIRWIGDMGIGIRVDPQLAEEAKVRY